MFVESYFGQSSHDGVLENVYKNVKKEVKFWARNGRRRSMGMIFFDVKINGKLYLFSYYEKSGDFLYLGDDGIQNIGSRVPRVYYTVDGMQFCVTVKGRLWVKQL